MSDVSKIKNEFLAFCASVMQHVPAEAQPAAQAAADSLHTALSEAEAAAVSTAEVAVLPTMTEAATKAAPAELAPLVPAIFQLGVAALTARLSTPTAA